MDGLERPIAEETAQVRAGTSKAFGLENAKIECARLYLMESERLKAAKGAPRRPRSIAYAADTVLSRICCA